MRRSNRMLGVAAGTALIASLALAQGPSRNASFFVTSHNPGDGGNLGGLRGADAYCTTLAEIAGIRDKTWRAYLSTDTVDARDRIGDGPWYNVRGVMIASDVDALHGDNNINNDTALDENGNAPPYFRMVNGEAQRPEGLAHDIMTGSNADGTANEMTCNNWTDGTSMATTMLGHADRIGRDPGPNSWNAIHASRGCDMENLIATGSQGLLYCFAID